METSDMKSVQLSRTAILCIFFGVAMAQNPQAFQRAFPIERAIQQADIAIGHPNGRPESIELLRVEYVVEPLEGDRYGGILLPDQAVRRLAGKTFWVLQYRQYPVTAGGGYSVFLNGLTGEKVYVARSK
jgi:hypothetical protein